MPVPLTEDIYVIGEVQDSDAPFKSYGKVVKFERTKHVDASLDH